MTNEELETIKIKLRAARETLRLSISLHATTAICYLDETITILDNVQKRVISFGRGPDCYNCNCKTKCERYA